jgi:hypothetical protein
LDLVETVDDQMEDKGMGAAEGLALTVDSAAASIERRFIACSMISFQIHDEPH